MLQKFHFSLSKQEIPAESVWARAALMFYAAHVGALKMLKRGVSVVAKESYPKFCAPREKAADASCI